MSAGVGLGVAACGYHAWLCELRLARENLVDLDPRLRRRTTLVARRLPRGLRQVLECDAMLVRTGVSAAAAYGWDELAGRADSTWLLDTYLPLEACSALQEQTQPTRYGRLT